MTAIDWRPQADGLWSGQLNGAGLQGDEEARLQDEAALEGGWEDDPMRRAALEAKVHTGSVWVGC